MDDAFDSNRDIAFEPFKVELAPYTIGIANLYEEYEAKFAWNNLSQRPSRIFLVIICLHIGSLKMVRLIIFNKRQIIERQVMYFVCAHTYALL